MGVIWVSLLLSQITMTNRVYFSQKELFHNNIDRAAMQSFKTLDKMSFELFFHGESFKECYRKYSGEQNADEESASLDSNLLFLQNIEGINEKLNFLNRYVKETQSCFDYWLLGYDVIDSVIAVNLRDNEIYDPFKIGLYCEDLHKFCFLPDGLDKNMVLEHGLKYSILSINSDGSLVTNAFYLYFPTLVNRFKRDIVISYVVIVLLLLLLLYCFIAFIVIVYRQRKFNEFRTQMLHSITHELKTPITTIELATQLLRDKTVQKDEESSNEYLTMISDESHSMLNMIDEVLTVFRAQKMPKKAMEEVRIHALLKSVVAANQLKLDQCKAKVNFDFQAEKDTVLGNFNHLSNGFSNLIDNAIKYRDGDLVIDISTKNVKDCVEIRFKDNGIGISKENQQVIFEPFTRVNFDNKHYVQGYGLGLNYLSQIIKYHKGSIKVESELSKGATFVVSLPLK